MEIGDGNGRSANLQSPVSNLHFVWFFVIAAVFLLVRLALLSARDPFFDELFTLWMARQPLSHVVPSLLHDSGPPLYYFVARFDSIVALRLLSLVFATMQFALVARRSLLAGGFLALYAPAALFAVDARAYALCALFVTLGVLSLENRSSVLGPRSSVYFAAICFALAAHSHYYGVLFFPLLLFPSLQKSEARGPRPEARLGAFALALVLFLPGFFLAAQQPSAALKWNREALLSPLTNLSFAGTYPYALFAGAPWFVALLALVLLAVALSRSSRFAPAVLVPLALVFALHLAGRPVYFPMRFEAVIAGPLMLWLGESLCAWQLPWRRVLAAPLVVPGVLSLTMGILDLEQRPMDPYRQAAMVLRQHLVPGRPVVATGYLYLETLTALGGHPVIAWPAEQALHPGWRATTPPDPASLPAVPFVWIGERFAPELPVLRGVKAVRPRFWNERALVAEATNLTAPVH